MAASKNSSRPRVCILGLGLVLTACLFASVVSVQAQLLVNGGFESGLSDWTTNLSNGGAAMFTNSTKKHWGTNALLVTVTSAGTASNSVQLTSSSFAASNADTYVLRFWANTDALRSRVGVNILGAAPVFPQIPFEISTNPTGSYQEYLYPFRASGAVSIAFNFQTAADYWLEDVEVLDLNNTDGWDIPMTYLWRWGQLNYANTNSIGWSGGDNQKSVALPDGTVAWICNDSFTSTLPGHFYTNVRGSCSLPRNSLVHQVGTNLYTMNNGNATFFVPTNTANIFWIGDGVVEGNKLLVLLTEVNASAITRVGTAIGQVSLPGLTLDNITEVPSPGADNYGAVTRGDDDFYYIYWNDNVARVPVGSLAVSSAWTYWNGSGWVTNHTQAVGVSGGPSSVDSMVELSVSNYAALYMPSLSTTTEAQFAPSPMGPWTSSISLFSGAGEWGEIYYMPNLCAGTGANGVYTIDYSDNGSPEGLAKWASDRSWYAPHYFTANLWNLSPYSWTNLANLAYKKITAVSSSSSASYAGANAVDGKTNTCWASASSDPQWISVDLGSAKSIGQVKLLWSTNYGQSYQIQVSNDNLTWTNIFSTTNGAGALETINFNPVQSRYVRMYGLVSGTASGYALNEFQVYPAVPALNTPAAPGPVSATVLAGNQIYLTWTNNATNETGFILYRKQGVSGIYGQLGTTAQNVTYYLDAVTNAGSYYYQVRATNAVGASDYSVEVSANTTNYRSGGDIGSVGVAGTNNQSLDVLTLQGGGADIGGTNDACQFVWQPVSGDCDVRGRVTSLAVTDPLAKAGVMIRESLDTGARMAATLLAASASTGMLFEYRTNTAGQASQTNLASLQPPYWVRLTRSGNLLSSYVSTNGIAWTELGAPRTVPMESVVYAGLAVSSHVAGTLCSATFSNFSIVALPAPWQTADIGSTAITGGAIYAYGAYQLWGSGADIWGTSDAFRYVYQSASGNCDIRARVTLIADTDSASKLGVMIRQSLSSNSVSAQMLIQYNGLTPFQYRTTTGGTVTSAGTNDNALPHWVRLTRVGNLFSGYDSADGTNWNLVASQTITMTSGVYIGLAMTSHNNSSLAVDAFDNVSGTGLVYRSPLQITGVTSGPAGLGFVVPGNLGNAGNMVESCTNLATGDWVPLFTNNTLDAVNFTDPSWTNRAGCFYRIQVPQ